MYIAGLDIGTTGCKCTVFDGDGHLLGKAYRDYPVRRAVGGHEIDISAMMDGVYGALSEMASRYPDIGGIGVTSFGETFVCVALPLTLLEYFFTKERITEEIGDGAETRSIREQFSAILHDKYWIILMAYNVVFNLGSYFKNASLVYYCNYVLGTYNDGVTQTLVSVIGGIPMGIGIFAVWPLAKKFGKWNVTLAGFILYAIGGAVCLIGPRNMVIVLAGQFIKNIGGLPCAYVFAALTADVLDHIEWKYTFRCDGLATSINSIIITVSTGVAAGVLNFCLARSGYVAPEFVEATGQTVGAVQNAATQNVFIFFFLGLEIITAIILILLLRFLDVEKHIDKEQAEIKARRRA